MMRKIQRFLSLMACGMNQAHRQNSLGGDIYIPTL